MRTISRCQTRLRNAVLGVLAIGFLMAATSCAPKIHRFDPPNGVAGTPVVIKGKNFGATPALNAVAFNEVAVPTADLVSASTTKITARVPSGATTGRISVKRIAPFPAMAVSASPFKVDTDPNEGSLPVTMHAQETGMWCWAASGQMVMDFLGHNVEQCVEANKRFGVNYCCFVSQTDHTPVTGCPKLQCVQGGWPEFDKFGFTFQRTSSKALTWNQLVHQIVVLKKPVAFSWRWNGTGGHMMVATGVHTINGVNYVDINDPWAPCVGDVQTITYDEYVQRPDDHTHWDDFYYVSYVGGP